MLRENAYDAAMGITILLWFINR